jgi:hypothetical protein
MPIINLSNIAFTKAKFRYSISELVDEFLKKKLDKEVREYVKNELGIDYVYKSYDFSKIDFDSGNFVESDVSINEMYYKTAKRSLRGVDSKK